MLVVEEVQGAAAGSCTQLSVMVGECLVLQRQNCQQLPLNLSFCPRVSVAPTLTVILYYLLPACVRRAELWFSSPAGGRSRLSFVHAACPPFSTKKLALLCDNKYRWNTLRHYFYPLPPLPSFHSLTPCALWIKERVYEPALAWQRWWGVITVERLSCSLHTLPLSSLGQEHDTKEN